MPTLKRMVHCRSINMCGERVNGVSVYVSQNCYGHLCNENKLNVIEYVSISTNLNLVSHLCPCVCYNKK
jgi:hypothetical protein